MSTQKKKGRGANNTPQRNWLTSPIGVLSLTLFAVALVLTSLVLVRTTTLAAPPLETPANYVTVGSGNINGDGTEITFVANYESDRAEVSEVEVGSVPLVDGETVANSTFFADAGIDTSHAIANLLTDDADYAGTGGANVGVRLSDSASDRGGFRTSWEGFYIQDVSGDDFVIAETSADPDLLGYYMVSIKAQGEDGPTQYFYKRTTTSRVSGGVYEFFTAFDIEDDFGFAEGTMVEYIEVVNMINSDRFDSTGKGYLGGAGATAYPSPSALDTDGFDTAQTESMANVSIPYVWVVSPDNLVEMPKITGRVWEDDNFDGIQDDGESGYGTDMKVTLWDEVDNEALPGNYWAEVQTDGTYTLYAPDDMCYRLKFESTTPTDMFFSEAHATTSDQDSDVTTSDSSDVPPITTATEGLTDRFCVDAWPDTTDVEDQVTENMDAGIGLPVEISGYFWEDVDGDGVMEFPGDDVEAGDTNDGQLESTDAEINLYRNGALVASCDWAAATTTPCGTAPAYSFGSATGIDADFPPGEYVLEFDFGNTAENAFTVRTTTNATASATDSDVDDDTNSTTYGRTNSFVVKSGSTESNVSAGAYVGLEYSGYVWNDKDGSGAFDAGETPLNNVTVNLFHGDNNDDCPPGNTGVCANDYLKLFRTTTTNAAGYYEFLVPDQGAANFYRIQVDPPQGYTYSPIPPATCTEDGTNTLPECNDLSDIEDLAAGPPVDFEGFTTAYAANDATQAKVVDAGLFRYATINGTLWEDADGDGLQDSNERGIGCTVGEDSFDIDGDGTDECDPTVADNDLVYVVLYDETCAGDPGYARRMTTTDYEGYYEFRVPVGSYCVDFDNPAATINTVDVQGLSTARTATYPDVVAGPIHPYVFTQPFRGSSSGVYSTYSNDSDVDDTISTTGAAACYGTTGRWNGADCTDNAITLVAGQEATIDAGAFEATDIGGYMWQDDNGNGLWDEAATAALTSGDKVYLYDSAGNPLRQTTLAPDDTANENTGNPELLLGEYRFVVPRNRSYVVEFAPKGYVFTSPYVVNPYADTLTADPVGNDSNANDDQYSADYGKTSTFTPEDLENPVDTVNPLLHAVSAGVMKSTVIGSYVWDDRNGDGIQTADEPPLRNIEVTLYSGDDVNMTNPTIIRSTTTRADGSYEFNVAIPSTGAASNFYDVVVSLPSGYVFSEKGRGTNADKDSDVYNGLKAYPMDGTGVLYPTANHEIPGVTGVIEVDDATVSGSTEFLHWADAGMYEPIEIGNYVWEDTDRDGIQDPGEEGINDVWVSLTCAISNTGTTYTNYNAEPIAQAVTGPNGGFGSTGEYRFTTFGNTWNADGYPQPVAEADGGKPLPSSIGPCTLTYTTTEDVYMATLQNGGKDDTLDSDIVPEDDVKNYIDPVSNETIYYWQSTSFSVKTGETATWWDAGLYQPARIGGYIWNDAFVDGKRGFAEDDATTHPATDTLTLMLQMLNEETGKWETVQTEPYTITIATEEDGTPEGESLYAYEFRVAAGGTYRVHAVPMEGSGWLLTDPNEGTNELRDSDIENDSTEDDYSYSHSVTVQAGDVVDDINVGLFEGAVIGERIWTDDNCDGLYSEKEGRPVTTDLITVTLLDEDGRELDVPEPTWTTMDPETGKYSITVRAGFYVLSVDIPDGYEFTTKSFAAVTGLYNDSDVYDTSESGFSYDTYGKTDAFYAPAGTDTISVNVGLKGVTIGNRVWHDENGDGMQGVDLDGDKILSTEEMTETGLSDVNVVLHDAISETALQTVTTENGYYTFTVPAGSYYVQVERPDGYLITKRYASGATGPFAVDGDSDVVNGKPSDADYGKSDSFTVEPVAGVCEMKLELDMGMVEAATISNFVWEDLNYDGMVNTTGKVESGLPGVTLEIYPVVNDVVGELYDTQITDSDGEYIFTVPAGTYRIKVQQYGTYRPTLHNPTVAPREANNDNDAMVNAKGEFWTADITVAGKEDLEWVDIGLYQPVTISDFVWNDANGNGIQDENEGVAGATIDLYFKGRYAYDAAGTLIEVEDFEQYGDSSQGLIEYVNTFTTLDDTGLYSFTNLVPGTYYLVFTTPNDDEWVFTLKDQRGDVAARFQDTVDSDPDPETGETPATTLYSGSDDDTWDAGMFQFVQLEGMAWNDYNQNGIYDPEAGIDCSDVEARKDNECPLNDIKITAESPDLDSDEYYVMTDMDGTYVITVPLGWVYELSADPIDSPYASFWFTMQDEGSDDTVDSDFDMDMGSVVVDTSTVAAGDIIDNDAGLKETPATIAGCVWNDYDNDGLGFNDGIPAELVGQPIEIWHTDANGVMQETEAFSTTVTGADGCYSFEVPGNRTYIVDFMPVIAATNNYTFTDLIGNFADDFFGDSDANWETGKTKTITVKPNQVKDDVDAGVLELAKIGDYVWMDMNGDGIQDADETGLEGVTAMLYRSDDTDMAIATTTTDADGMYEFTMVRPGDYVVGFTLPENDTPYLFTDKEQGNGSNDSDVNYEGPNAGMTDAFTVYPGNEKADQVDDNDDGMDKDIDAGVYPAITITGLVWDDGENTANDQRGDGIRQETVFVADAKVSLLKPNGTLVTSLTMTTTDDKGAYTFTGLRAGDYIIHFTAPAGSKYIFSKWNQGEDDTIDSDANADRESAGYGRTMVVSVMPSGSPYSGVDAGMYKECRLAGFAWYDSNNNSAFEAGGFYNTPYNDPYPYDPVEQGIADIWVYIVRGGTGPEACTGRGNHPAIATEEQFGRYVFDGLVPDNYVVCVDSSTVPDNYMPTTDESYMMLDSCCNDDDPYCIMSTDGFGYIIADGEIDGYVWNDYDGSGDRAACMPAKPEKGIPGIVVDLLYDGTSVLTATTNENGRYVFDEDWEHPDKYKLRIGNYEIRVNDEQANLVDEEYVRTTPELGEGISVTLELENPAVAPSTVVLKTQMGCPSARDFGYWQVGTISGVLWDDDSNDGVLDAAETGRLEGIWVALIDANNTVVQTTTTAADGSYMFEDVPAANYTVNPFETDGIEGSVDVEYPSYIASPADDPNPVRPAAVEVNPGEDVTDVDFGYIWRAGCIEAFVYDADTGKGIADVDVIVTRTADEIVPEDGLTTNVTGTVQVQGVGEVFVIAGGYTVAVVESTLPVTTTEGEWELVEGTNPVSTTTVTKLNETCMLEEFGYHFELDPGSPPPDLHIAKTGKVVDNGCEYANPASDEVCAGGVIEYTIAYSNSGEAAQDDVRIVDTLPVSVTFERAIPANMCDDAPNANNELTCTIGTLAAGAEGEIVIRVIVPEDASEGEFTNTASIYDQDDEASATSSFKAWSILDVPPDLAITKTSKVTDHSCDVAKTADDQACLGAIIEYTLAYTNTGAAQSSVTIVDTLPFSPTGAVSIVPDVCTKTAGNVYECNVGPVGTYDPAATNGEGTGSIVMTVSISEDDEALIGTSIINSASIRDQDGNETDSNTDAPGIEIREDIAKVYLPIILKQDVTIIVLTPTPMPATPTPVPGEATPTPMPATATPMPATPTPMPEATATPTPVGPNLVVEDVRVSPASGRGDDVVIEIDIINDGDVESNGGFWVDLYLNPSSEPEVNELWQDLCGNNDPCHGVAFKVMEELKPNGEETITLRTDGNRKTQTQDPGGRDYFVAIDQSEWPGAEGEGAWLPNGTQDIYVLADSYNCQLRNGEKDPDTCVPEGHVIETDETDDNLYHHTLSSPVTGSPNATTQQREMTPREPIQ